jgi:hypothetical protein
VHDKQAKLILRYAGFALILVCGAYLVISSAEEKWLYAMLAWVIFAISLIIYRYCVYRKVYKNFRAILGQKKGAIKGGKLLFCNPPQRKIFIFR